jgi:hypothetical protein
MRRRKTYIIVLSVSALLTIAMLIQMRISNKKNKLKRGGLLTTAVVTDCRLLPKNGNSLDVAYTFLFRGNDYNCETTVMGIYLLDFNSEFIGKHFPVIYLPENPKNSEILITPDRFERFGISFPDSLKWVRRFWTKDYISFD